MTQPHTSPRSWLARTLLPLALVAAGVNAACVPLTGTTVCAKYAGFEVDNAAAVKYVGGMGVKMASFEDVKGFDAAVTGATGFQSSSSCTGYTPSLRIRYQDTLLCAVMVSKSSGCKNSAPNMCQTTCTDYSKALADMVNATCPNDKTSQELATEMSGYCARGTSTVWESLVDVNTATCINGSANEPTTCGFGNQTSMCTFCTNPANAADTCCTANAASCTPVTTSLPTTVPTPSSGGVTPPAVSSPPSNEKGSSSSGPGGLSTAALGGIIGGGVVALLGLFALIVCCMRRSKNKSPSKGNGGSQNLSRHMSNSSASKYKISSPKMQEEGFAAAVAPSAPIPMTALPPMSSSEPAAAAAVVAAATAANRVSKGSSVGGAAATNGKQSYCQALYPYQASMADELDLSPGDIVNVQRVFDDGWAVGVNMNTSNEGAFPVVCVMFVDEASLDDDFEDVNMHSMTPMSHREDESKSNSRSSLPSRASSPVHLPRRHSSMIRDSAVIPQGNNNNNNNNSMTSSPLAGGKLQPPPAVRDTMMSDASSINRWWDGEGTK
ncbi:hypothetical protein EC968_003288 [Mortierella alpina]|nr:hypothetical protein EC968_003288 [Mortierella alpina]